MDKDGSEFVGALMFLRPYGLELALEGCYTGLQRCNFFVKKYLLIRQNLHQTSREFWWYGPVLLAQVVGSRS